MWCDNCCLLLPLRAGAIAWGTVIFLYSLAGSIVLFIYGKFLFFVYPEWYIYGGISMVIALIAFINVIALANSAYTWIRVSTTLWPFLITISCIRVIIMLIELRRGESNIIWECNNGGQLWPSNVQYVTTLSTMPATICNFGIPNLITAFIISLLVDVAFQIYMYFLAWRFRKRMEHYDSMKGPFDGGIYA